MKTYNIYCKEENSFEYVFTVLKIEEETHYQLDRSGSDHWTHPGERLLNAVDNGNEIKFTDKTPKTLDYSQFSELYLFLNLIKLNDESLMGKYQVIDTSTIHEI